MALCMDNTEIVTFRNREEYSMKFSQEAVLTAVCEGACKYADEQFEVLRRFCSINCASRK